MRKLASEYSEAAEECNRRGYKTFAQVNRDMANHYISKANSMKSDFDVNSDTD